MSETRPLAHFSHERFIDHLKPTTDHDAHCQTYWRILALGALRSKAWLAYEYYRSKAGDHIGDPPRNP